MARMFNDSDDLKLLVFSVVSFPPLPPVLANIVTVVRRHLRVKQLDNHILKYVRWCGENMSSFDKIWSMIHHLKPLGVLMVK